MKSPAYHWGTFCYWLSWWLGGRWGREVLIFGRAKWATEDELHGRRK